jgi:hypothetical protein
LRICFPGRRSLITSFSDQTLRELTDKLSTLKGRLAKTTRVIAADI